MRDLALITPTEKTNWCLDFDIIDGYPRYVPTERNTQDQRAAVAAYMIRGTIPGKWSERSPGEGNGNILQYSCLGNPMDRGAWWAAVPGVAKSQT